MSWIIFSKKCMRNKRGNLFFQEFSYIWNEPIFLDSSYKIFFLFFPIVLYFVIFFLTYFENEIFYKIEMRNSKGRSGTVRVTFWLILQKHFTAFLHRKLKVAQIWSTHQSKALIFYFGIQKNFWVGFLKILSKTDKLDFIFWNLGCVCK